MAEEFDNQEDQDANLVNITELTDEEVKSELQEEPTPEPNEDDDLPEKYRGKSKAELARMHEEAQSALGRQSNEVGELRKVFDEYIQSNVKSQQEAPTEEDPVDFLLDPEKAVNQAVANHPKLKQAEQVVTAMARQQARDKIVTDFPEIGTVLADPKFLEWKDASPIRKQLYDNADTNFDYASVAELMEGWKSRNRVVEETVKMEKAANANAVKEASTGNVRGNPDVKQRKKVYRRADIIKLMKDDPNRYEALQEEIMQAYSEGRVK